MKVVLLFGGLRTRFSEEPLIWLRNGENVKL